MKEIERILLKNGYENKLYNSLCDPSYLFKHEEKGHIIVHVDSEDIPIKITYLSEVIGCHLQMNFHITENFKEENINNFIFSCSLNVSIENSKLVS